jgi:flagellar hook-associated protein 2
MSSLQISGLASGINWTTIVNELVQADSAGLTQVQDQQAAVNNQISALGSLTTDMNNLSSAIFSLESPSLYSGVTAASTTSGSTWTASAESGTPTGSYTIDVSNLATASKLDGATGIANSLDSGGAATTTPLASLATAVPITAGTFTVNGRPITITTAEDLDDVFTAISAATGGTVTGSYDSGTDTVKLSGGTTPVVLGADNDTSNLLQALGLSNDGSDTVTSVKSAFSLGAVQLQNPIASSNLAGTLTGLDSSGNGSFEINGVTINYNVNTDSMATLLGLINKAGAGVEASYDTANGTMVLTNTSTGDTGIGTGDLNGGSLLAALGLTTGAGATLAQGENASFTVNGGPLQTSQSNTLGPAALGVTGLSVTVNSEATQTVQVSPASSAVQTAIQSFISSFNQLQADIQADTAVTTKSDGTITTSVLSGNTEAAGWTHTLETVAFAAGSGVGGAISSLNDLGIDFNGTSGELQVSDSAKLQQALTQNPAAVAAFFQTAKTGFGSIMNSTVNDIINQSADDQQNLQGDSTSLGTQITTMQTQLAAEQQSLDAEFQAMESMMSEYENESQTLTDIYSGSSTGLGNIATSVNNSVSSTTGSSGSTTSTSGSSSS